MLDGDAVAAAFDLIPVVKRAGDRCDLGVATGVAIGMTLPHSTTASVALLGGAAACLVLVAVRRDAVAPLHGLHRIVRLPFGTSVAATFASLWSRVAGSVGAVAQLRPRPTPLVLDEPDDEADEWWGVRPDATVAAEPPVVDAPVVEGTPVEGTLVEAWSSREGLQLEGVVSGFRPASRSRSNFCTALAVSNDRE
mgnify:CR=1 FL=1